MAASPVFTATPHVEISRFNTANTNVDGTGTIATVFTAGASGSRVDRIIVEQSQGTSTNGMVRLFLYDGTSYRLFREVTVTAATSSATVQCFTATVALSNFYIPGTSGFNRIAASTHNAEQFNVIVMGSDL